MAKEISPTKIKATKDLQANTTKDLQHLDMRSSFKALQLSNANYFGNIKESKEKSVVQIAGNIFYEELKCVSYNPDSQLLNAAITIKQSGGYGGGPCTNGSVEYVRFYVDYLRNGNWVDEGIAATNVHDLTFSEDFCYNVRLKINPKKSSCCDDAAVLPLARAILSWNSMPPANSPNWTPVWGNVMNTNIQISPSHSIWCYIKKGIKLDDSIQNQLLANIEKLQPLIPDFPPKPDPGPLMTLQNLQQVYKGKVEDTRIVMKQFDEISNVSALSTTESKINATGFNWAELVDKIKLLKFNTTYEEVKCVALNRELNTLHASVIVKKPVGYSGDLCHPGSKEYVAFYMDFGSGYIYIGTSSVGVHDISTMPNDGLWYNVMHSVNLQPYQKEWCIAGKAKVKAILSWNVAPPANNPNYVASYGDWEECQVEIKPLPKSVSPGKTTVVSGKSWRHVSR